MLKRVLVSSLIFAMLAPRLSADEAARRLQSPQPATIPDTGHPYKWHGLIMAGIGGLISLAALYGTAGIEGSDSRYNVLGD